MPNEPRLHHARFEFSGIIGQRAIRATTFSGHGEGAILDTNRPETSQNLLVFSRGIRVFSTYNEWARLNKRTDSRGDQWSEVLPNNVSKGCISACFSVPSTQSYSTSTA